MLTGCFILIHDSLRHKTYTAYGSSFILGLFTHTAVTSQFGQ
ncbi:hypothetical protein CRENPOLYSF1_50166 [Crenothrix polyspora]|uniref:Uncharacterized protein n=1 Tax=Crenothrix polyspora TaxID=360316 RepID=A0A1R4HDS1_9GAMM|nr:hypothetical protein CRENPOLYSF1_50166 [Crenothrix polyspora]